MTIGDKLTNCSFLSPSWWTCTKNGVEEGWVPESRLLP